MFRDLKEYQQIQKIYEERVCITEEERYITKELKETFTEDEINFIAENAEEVFAEIGNQLVEEGSEIAEETIDEMAKAVAKAVVPLAQRMTKAAAKNKNLLTKSAAGGGAVAKKVAAGGGAVAKKAASGGGGLMKKAGGLIKKGVGFVKKNAAKVAGAVGVGGAAAGAAIATRNKPKPKPETDSTGKVIPSTAQIRADAAAKRGGTPAIGGGNAGASTDSGGTSKSTIKSVEQKPKVSTMTKQGKPRTKAQMMAAKRIASGKTIQQVKDENKASMKAKAAERFAAFKAKRAEKKAAMEEFTPYDIVLEYLLSSQQAATIEEANYIMTEMDAKTIQSIVAE